MVSVPDWSKLGLLLEQAKATVTTVPNNYARFKDEEAIKQAEEHGYFLNITRQFLEQNFLPPQPGGDSTGDQTFLAEDSSKPDLSEMIYVKLMRGPLRSLGSLNLCVGLKICILSNNYITRFDALAGCTQLVKLDLHSNQISLVPGAKFWAGMKNLVLLHLHDNPIGKAENIHYLAGAPSLTAMTMFDTPLSLKLNYRHHMVNTLWSLRALDDFVVSDEEVIEEAEFDGRFTALHRNFALDLCPPTPEDSSYDDELGMFHQVMSCINYILAHSSPVIIIQRYTRGCIARRLYKKLKDAKIWASVKIQRVYRTWKDLTPPETTCDVPSPPETVKQAGKHSAHHVHQGADVLKIDYDTYLRNRRPGSTGISEVGSRTSKKSARLMLQTKTLKSKSWPLIEHIEVQLPFTSFKEQDESSKPFEKEDQTVNPGLPSNPSLPGVGKHMHVNSPEVPPDEDSPEPRRKNLFINLAKLHTTTMQNLHDESIAMEISFPSELSYMHDDSLGRLQLVEKKKVQKKSEPERKRQVIKSVKQFFGPVVESVRSPEPRDGSRQDEDEDIPMVNFRLKGRKHHIRLLDVGYNMYMGRAEAGRDMREAEMEYHHKAEQAPKPMIPPKSGPTHEFKVQSKMKGALPGFSCLTAVQRAYKERSKAQTMALKKETVQSLKEQREAGKQRINMYLDDRRKNIIGGRERDQKRVQELLDKHELYHLNDVSWSMEHQNKSSQHRHQRKAEKSFLYDFGTQNASISKALMRHDRITVADEQLQRKTTVVSAHREKIQEQQEMVKQYMEHRKLMWQTETALHKAALDSKMLQEANDRLLQARQRVAQQRARSTNVEEATFVLPSISNHSLTTVSQDEDCHLRSRSTGGIRNPAGCMTQAKLTRLSTAAV